MSLQTFRYAACGGSNLLMNFTIFTVLWQIFTAKNDTVTIYGHVFKPESIALFIAGFISFFVGFALNKYIVFEKSNLKSRIQLFRYFVSFASNLALNYIFLTGLVSYAHLHPVFAQSVVTVVMVFISYLTQRHYSFKVIDKTIDN